MPGGHTGQENTMNAKKYYAWAGNEEGASLSVDLPMSERRRSRRAYEDAARRQLGAGWTVHIMCVEVEGQAIEVNRFTIRS